MAKGILGKKIGITQIFDEKGFSIPVTVVHVADNIVIQQKNLEKDGYQATKLGFGSRKEKLTKKPLLGIFKKIKIVPKSFIKEIRFISSIQNKLTNFEVGSVVPATELFSSGEFVDVTAVSIGKGFAGPIKRHNQTKGPETHGSRFHRRPGSMGPIKGKIKGKKLAGQMGHTQVTIQNLKLVSIHSEKELFLIQGSIPGPKNSFVVIKSSVKKMKGGVDNNA
ncbi:50S ribosomal protein L3 [Candidatus Phytoplasma pini]|uniref:Large ribosomal subunit protein uL3 n=1 Tax=Candidatus Phytoplasma pini TaxID=267362 RepID=A0A559KJR7_9MOLU|nr:50S ribosomal protein L3 [Candidatus Phytoplasma pini]TVY12359.1 50S ribosomal protein L3 [Candidatus Phytoplasma pini]